MQFRCSRDSNVWTAAWLRYTWRSLDFMPVRVAANWLTRRRNLRSSCRKRTHRNPAKNPLRKRNTRLHSETRAPWVRVLQYGTIPELAPALDKSDKMTSCCLALQAHDQDCQEPQEPLRQELHRCDATSLCRPRSLEPTC